MKLTHTTGAEVQNISSDEMPWNSHKISVKIQVEAAIEELMNMITLPLVQPPNTLCAQRADHAVNGTRVLDGFVHLLHSFRHTSSTATGA